MRLLIIVYIKYKILCVFYLILTRHNIHVWMRIAVITSQECIYGNTIRMFNFGVQTPKIKSARC